LYPNPSTGNIFIQLPQGESNIELSIFDLQSQLRYRKIISESQQLNIALPSGIYQSVITGSHTQVDKLIIE